MTTFDRAALLRAAEAANDLHVAIVDLLDTDPDPEPPEGDDLRARIEHALSEHPRVCDTHDDDPIQCGWKAAVASVESALRNTGPIHPMTVNPATDPEPPDGTVLDVNGLIAIRDVHWQMSGFGRWLAWSGDHAALPTGDCTVLRWGWEGSASTNASTEREVASCGPRSTDAGTYKTGAQNGTQSVTLATGRVKSVTSNTWGEGTYLEIALDDGLLVDPADAEDGVGLFGRVRIVAEDGDER